MLPRSICRVGRKKNERTSFANITSSQNASRVGIGPGQFSILYLVISIMQKQIKLRHRSRNEHLNEEVCKVKHKRSNIIYQYHYFVLSLKKYYIRTSIWIFVLYISIGCLRSVGYQTQFTIVLHIREKDLQTCGF